MVLVRVFIRVVSVGALIVTLLSRSVSHARRHVADADLIRG
jgi:hypothetical protein